MIAGKDTETLLQLTNDSEAAFSALMKKYYPALYRYGLRLTKDEALLTDCIQDVFINLWQNRHTAAAITYLQQYLLIALRRRILRVMQQERKSVLLTEEQANDPAFVLEFSVEDLIVEKQLEQEKADKLKELLNKLPQRQKEVIYLLYYQQQTPDQVAGIMQINRQSVYNLLSESMRRLKAFWRDTTPI